MIYRGAGFLTLLTPIVSVLLLTYFFHDPSAGQGNTTLQQFLLGCGAGAAVNVVIGLALNRGARAPGEHARHHFFFMPMQWPALAIVIVCAAVAALKI